MNKKTQQLKNHQSYIKTLEAKLKDASKVYKARKA